MPEVPEPKESSPAGGGPFRLVGRIIVSIVLIVYMAIDAILTLLLWPAIAQLSRLRLFQRLGEGIARLPPYVVLVLLAIPFILIEPVKVFAVYWIASGHLMQGPVLLVAAYVLSILICDRIYHAGHAKLMQIGWFKTLMDWLIGLRNRGVGWIKSRPAWVAVSQAVANLRRRVVAAFRTIG
ncbi:MAG: hypothetical protein JWN11_1584 [Hyphomicrobiales bacterium]|nr:hypothetical protein [Hyphomicrobiales bacterium]